MIQRRRRGRKTRVKNEAARIECGSNEESVTGRKDASLCIFSPTVLSTDWRIEEAKRAEEGGLGRLGLGLGLQGLKRTL